MDRTGIARITWTCVVFCLAVPAHAALVDRGGGLVFDSDRNITWLADANLGAGSAYDDGLLANDGLMTWQSAVDWAAHLDYGGFSDWRLPATPLSDATCSIPPVSFGTNCTGSELGHLYNTELGGTVLSPAGFTPAPGPGPFTNIQADGYWSGTAYDAGFAYVVNFGFSGQQAADNKTLGYYAWAVHDGDIGAVPGPPAAWLLGTALLGLAGRLRRRSAP